MKSGPRIIIKPRGSAPGVSSRNAATPSAPNTPNTEGDSRADQQDDELDEEREDDEDEGAAMNVDEQAEGSGTASDDDKHEATPATATPRPRGRPRGRGRGTVAASATSRGRGRGRGRARGRPRAITIKLPKKDDDSDGNADGEEGDGQDEGEGDEGDKDGPVAGGKPFRRINGQAFVIEGDEFVTDRDPKGDEKIDQFGNLLGGRKFKASTFLLPNRHPERQYMLAIDAARTSGFRDSLYYFRRNLLALKLNATQPEKDYLISIGKLGPHLRTRSVTLVTALSAFKLHGSKTIIDGRWVVDDYYEEKVLEEIKERGLKAGDPVGELPDPNASHHSNELSALNAATGGNKGERGGVGGMYRPGGSTTLFGGTGLGPYSDGPLNAVRKSILSRDGVTEENWMWMMATRVMESSVEWSDLRTNSLKFVEPIDGVVVGGDGSANPKLPAPPPPESTPPQEEARDGSAPLENTRPAKKRPIQDANLPAQGTYEPHSNLNLYRADSQVTSAEWQVLPDSQTKRRVLGGTKVGNGAWGLAWIDTVIQLNDRYVEEQAEYEHRMKIVREAEAERVCDAPGAS